MSDYPKGLRFDIYERITLPEEVVGIGELEDIELLPRITMQTHGDQAVLSGDLMLVGTYVGVEADSGIKQLRHRIPVEITLPLRRIRRMDNIGIEIENFDVELLSARSLNITGVISLSGVDTASEPSTQELAWKDQGEAWFVHEAARPEAQSGWQSGQPEAARPEAQSGWQSVQPEAQTELETSLREAALASSEQDGDAAGSSTAPAESETILNGAGIEPSAASRDTIGQAGSAYEFRAEGQDPSSAGEARVEPQPAPEKLEPTPPPKEEQPTVQAQVEVKEAVVKGEADKANAVAAEEAADKKSAAGAKDGAGNLSAAEAADQAAKSLTAEAADQAAKTILAQQANEQAAAPQEKTEPQEMKIAFGSNKQDSGWPGAVAGMKSLLQQVFDKPVQTVDEQADAEDGENKQEKRGEESIQWKNLLLSGDREEQRFRKMRMCIVQKEETLDTIASRYSLNPKEIVLYNRLESEQVYEGQIIYIPK